MKKEVMQEFMMSFCSEFIRREIIAAHQAENLLKNAYVLIEAICDGEYESKDRFLESGRDVSVIAAGIMRYLVSYFASPSQRKAISCLTELLGITKETLRAAIRAKSGGPFCYEGEGVKELRIFEDALDFCNYDAGDSVWSLATRWAQSFEGKYGSVYSGDGVVGGDEESLPSHEHKRRRDQFWSAQVTAAFMGDVCNASETYEEDGLHAGSIDLDKMALILATAVESARSQGVSAAVQSVSAYLEANSDRRRCRDPFWSREVADAFLGDPVEGGGAGGGVDGADSGPDFSSASSISDGMSEVMFGGEKKIPDDLQVLVDNLVAKQWDKSICRAAFSAAVMSTQLHLVVSDRQLLVEELTHAWAVRRDAIRQGDTPVSVVSLRFDV